MGREASARAPRRRQACASSEEQYCVACWDEHLGVGAEADEAEAEGEGAVRRIDVAVALHACDIATDEAPP